MGPLTTFRDFSAFGVLVASSAAFGTLFQARALTRETERGWGSILLAQDLRASMASSSQFRATPRAPSTKLLLDCEQRLSM